MMRVAGMSELIGKKIGFIGAGRMAEAIFSGLLNRGKIDPWDLILADVSAERLDEMEKKYSVFTVKNGGDDNTPLRALLSCRVIVLAIKPQGADALLSQIGGWFTGEHLLISIMGGITLSFLQERIPGAAVIRVMPNAPMLVGAGAAGVALGEKASAEDGETAMALFQAVGHAYLCPERCIDPLTGVSG
jgi:pyrroline-5-carboxylate reductase